MISFNFSNLSFHANFAPIPECCIEFSWIITSNIRLNYTSFVRKEPNLVLKNIWYWRGQKSKRSNIGLKFNLKKYVIYSTFSTQKRRNTQATLKFRLLLQLPTVMLTNLLLTIRISMLGPRLSKLLSLGNISYDASFQHISLQSDSTHYIHISTLHYFHCIVTSLS